MAELDPIPYVERTRGIGGTALFWASKRIFDLGMSILLLPVLAICALVLLILNPFGNPGPLFFVQIRMGRDCRAFRAIKFRSMVPMERMRRGHDDPIEHDRITPLGRVLRRSRIDELSQILNVLRGEMSLIGPRPDYFAHAKVFMRAIPEYRHRHVVRPGISGLAQVDLGYIEGIEATRAKAYADLAYIRNAGFALDGKLVWRTIQTVVRHQGA
ncbi:MAG: sugar transferase [Rhodobacteraceae bacterium]|nr:sugar transferase [Paracoccaceae bacterium]